MTGSSKVVRSAFEICVVVNPEAVVMLFAVVIGFCKLSTFFRQYQLQCALSGKAKNIIRNVSGVFAN